IEERQREIEKIRQLLFLRLERIRNGATRDLSVIFKAQMEGNRLILPWERNPGAEEFRKAAAETPYAAQIQHGEREELVVNESERLTRLLNNVLDFSKIERGQKMYRLEPSSLALLSYDIGLPMLCRELNRQPVRRRNTVMLSEVFTEAVEVKR
ncbi:MAG: hypothetical protein HY646_11515, partial [Acidobacteria bacterium]|nr:hypothetical protein [Acidobacteriota bacterium]